MKRATPSPQVAHLSKLSGRPRRPVPHGRARIPAVATTLRPGGTLVAATPAHYRSGRPLRRTSAPPASRYAAQTAPGPPCSAGSSTPPCGKSRSPRPVSTRSPPKPSGTGAASSSRPWPPVSSEPPDPAAERPADHPAAPKPRTLPPVVPWGFHARVCHIRAGQASAQAYGSSAAVSRSKPNGWGMVRLSPKSASSRRWYLPPSGRLKRVTVFSLASTTR